MSVARIALLVLLVAQGPAFAQRPAVRLILPSTTSLDNPPPKKLAEPPPSNPIELVPTPPPLPALTAPTAPVDTSRLLDQLRTAFPASAVRLGYVGDRLVLTGHADDAGEARAIETLVQAAAGPRLVSHLRVRGRVLFHVLIAEVDRRAAAGVGLPSTNGVGDPYRTAAALAALCSKSQATVLAATEIPAVEGKTAEFADRRCQVTLSATASADVLRLAVTAQFGPSDRREMAQGLQTVVELRLNEALVLTGRSAEDGRDVVLVVTPEWSSGK